MPAGSRRGPLRLPQAQGAGRGHQRGRVLSAPLHGRLVPATLTCGLAPLACSDPPARTTSGCADGAPGFSQAVEIEPMTA